MVDDYPQLSSVSTGLKCACPRCGQGPLFQGLLTVRQVCPSCGLDYTRFNTDDGAAFFIIVLYSALVIPLALWLEFSLEPPIWVHLLVWVPVIVGGSVALMRPLKAWLIAQQFRHQVDDSDSTR